MIFVRAQEDIEAAFGKFGSINSIWIARKPPGFGFIEFADARDAEDACKDMDGQELDKERVTNAGTKIKVQISNGGGRGGGGGGGGGYRGGGYAIWTQSCLLCTLTVLLCQVAAMMTVAGTATMTAAATMTAVCVHTLVTSM
jgi:hypothetical protein